MNRYQRAKIYGGYLESNTDYALLLVQDMGVILSYQMLGDGKGPDLVIKTHSCIIYGECKNNDSDYPTEKFHIKGNVLPRFEGIEGKKILIGSGDYDWKANRTLKEQGIKHIEISKQCDESFDLRAIEEIKAKLLDYLEELPLPPPKECSMCVGSIPLQSSSHPEHYMTVLKTFILKACGGISDEIITAINILRDFFFERRTQIITLRRFACPPANLPASLPTW